MIKTENSYFYLHLLIISILLLSLGWQSNPNDKLSIGSSAEETFELEPGFKIELVASEPFINDPVDMEIDEYGNR